MRPTHRPLRAKPALASSCAFLLWVGAADACARWDLSGPVVIHQANGIRVVGDLGQSDETLSGTLRFWSTTLAPDAQVRVGGVVDAGSVVGDRIRFRVRWRADWTTSTKRVFDPYGFDEYVVPHIWEATGVYEGSITGAGRVEGTSFNESAPQRHVRWTLRDPVKCAPPPVAAAPRESIGRGMDDGIDRPGGDYARLELAGRDPEACQLACIGAGDRCRAWTYVRPGVQGPGAVCYLKSTVVRPVPDACCISGVPPRRTSPGALRERTHTLPGTATLPRP